jgi:hypothetical protein
MMAGPRYVYLIALSGCGYNNISGVLTIRSTCVVLQQEIAIEYRFAVNLAFVSL